MGHGGGQTHYKPTTTICGIGGTLYGATDIEILEGEGEDFSDESSVTDSDAEAEAEAFGGNDGGGGGQGSLGCL